MSGFKGLKKRRRLQVLGLAGVSMAAVFVALWFLPDDWAQFFRSPTEVIAATPPPTELFRTGGLVEPGSVVRGESETIRFVVTDGATALPVTYTGILPDLFAEGEGVVAQGRLVNGTFEAVEILAKHDETYMPREVIEALKEQGVYVAPGDATAAAPALN